MRFDLLETELQISQIVIEKQELKINDDTAMYY